MEFVTAVLTTYTFKTSIPFMNVQNIRSGRVAATLVAHPLRPRILANAREPISASDLARRLGQPRQRVNYHVRQLAAAGLLEPAGQQRKRNMVEQQYVASAHGYVLSPELLGEAAASVETSPDNTSAAHLVAVCARAQSEVAQVMASASAAGLRLRTMSMQTEVRFAAAEQRAEFTRALNQAVTDVITDHTREAAGGSPFRVVLACYPVPGGT
jgi:DNA-binding transcriptional ArsR family regulator